MAPWLAPGDGALPAWGFLLFVVAIDVAHVHSTLFRTYLDRAELARRPLLYAGVPLACLSIGLLLHSHSSELFWRVLAYVALTHFIRQQVGWVAIYRARAGHATRLERVIDDAAVYAATLYPVLYWHTTPRAFAWFVPGDFVRVELSAILPVAAVLYVLALVAYVVVSVQKTLKTKRLELGKHVVVLSTVLTWYVGIVLTNSDFAFTVANVIVHGVPYMALLWVYARKRVAADGAGIPLIRVVVRAGLAAFVVLLGAIAFAEEMLWDRLVWHSHPTIFGESGESELSAMALSLLVPLLALPQATHYVLDAVLWRRRDTGETQGRALGFAGAATPPSTASSPARP
ncbi:MAG: hypothetical protein JNK04_04550 [Myxococcales bacterium]|nr:hypothetical protein [Myxococcales bacterium]